MNDFIRVLLIEDDEQDAELVRLALERGGFELDWRRVDNETDLRLALARESWDVIISDFAMPGFDGLRAFQIVQQLRLDIPFIFVSGALGEERAVAAMRAGARDYILKGNLTRLSVAVRRELAASRIKQSERRLEANARQEQRRLGIAVEVSGAGIFEFRRGDTDPYVSPRLLEILGLEASDVPSAADAARWVRQLIHPEDRAATDAAFHSFMTGELDRLSIEARIRRAPHVWTDIAAFAKAVSRDEKSRATHVIGVIMDVTERHLLEAQLRQAQKMEAIGRLAGGVAHDFNNLLTAILSFSRFAMKAIDENSKAYKDLEEVVKAAKRAETLTGQLLAFSRRKPIAPQIVNVNELITDVQRMLARVVGEDVQIETRLGQDVKNIRMDPGSLEQVIMNLSVNARDAMPHGGQLTLATEDVVTRQVSAFGDGFQVPPGRYLRLRVSDNGTGMDEATLRRIFEPFFTTKGVGAGTGLGLATCYGIVQQAGGFIAAESTIGVGTTFSILLPTTTEVPQKLESSPPSQRVGGRETILVVEDEEPLRRLAVRALSEFGYRVMEAKNGVEALTSFEQACDEIDLLLTDVVMPEMGGIALAQRLTNINPRMRVLFMSGYAPTMVANERLLEPGVSLLQKPFTPDQLGISVKNSLMATRTVTSRG